jgi:small subunit ribosomal protein S17
MVNTIKVGIEYKTIHPRYKKVLNRKKFFLAHNDTELKVGDKVTIRECKPYSKNVSWAVVK